MHNQFISQRAECEHTDDHREVGWGARKHFKAHGRFVALISRRVHGELIFALLVRKTLGGMYFEMHKQFISQRAGCEHTDDHREVGWGTRKHFNFFGGSRFWRSCQEAHAVSCGILRKVESDLIPCEFFISVPLGS